MYCKKCGAYVPDGYSICPDCGEENRDDNYSVSNELKDIVDNAADSLYDESMKKTTYINPESTQEDIMQRNGGPYPDTLFEAQPIYTDQSAARNSNSKTAIICISVIAGVLVALAIVFAVLWQTGVVQINKKNIGTVSTETVEVPDFAGKDYNDIINDAYYKTNFKFERNESFSTEFENGYVMQQSYQVGDKVPKGTTITLTVSKGEETIVFPTSGIIGAKYEDAYRQLSDLGFTVNEAKKDNNGDGQEGTVQSATLEAGASYPKGTKVYLLVWGAPN